MALGTWLARCLPGLSTLFLLTLCECALNILQTEYIKLSYPTFLARRSNPVFAQALFIIYSLFLHSLSFAFSLRLCGAIRQATRDIRNCHGRSRKNEYNSGSGRGSSETTDANKTPFQSPDVVMAILIPSYREEIHVLEETLQILASHELAKASYDVPLHQESHRAVD